MPKGVYKHYSHQGFQKGHTQGFRKGHEHSESMKRRWQNPEYRKKVREGMAKMAKNGRPKNWASLYTPEINEKRRIARLKQKLPIKNTSIELKVKEWLEERKIRYVQQFNLGNKFQCDFYLPSLNLIVECDGEYWHSREDMKRRDRSKDAYAKKCGFNILRLTESEINKGRISLTKHI